MKKKQKANVFQIAAVVLALLCAILAGAGYMLNEENKALDADVAALNGNVAGLEDKVDALVAKTDQLDQANQDLVAEREALVDQNNLLEQEVATLQDEVGAKQSEIEDLNNQVEEIVATQPVELEGYVIDEISIGDDLEEVLDDGELESLADAELELDGEDYDFHEIIELSDNLILASNGLYGYDEDMGREAYLVFGDEGTVDFSTIFDDPVDISVVDDDEPLEFPIAGHWVTVVSIDEEEMEIRYGEELVFKQGESLIIDGREVMFVDAGDDEAIFNIDGEQVVLDEGDTEKVDGFEIYLKEVIAVNSELKDEDVAVFYAGENIYEVLDNGDELMQNPDWYMYWQIDGDELEFIEVWYDEVGDEVDDTYPPLAAGECLEVPFQKYELCYDGLNKVDYVAIELSFDNVDAEDDLAVDTNMVILEADENIFVVDNEELDELFISREIVGPAANWNVYYYNDDNELTLASSDVVIENDDFELDLILQVYEDRNLVIGKVSVDVRPSEMKIGNVEEEAEATDLLINTASYGGVEEDVLAADGIIVEDIENRLEEDELRILIPSDDVEGQVRIVYKG